MRKFTKEISALLASVAVGGAAFAGAVSASSEAADRQGAVRSGTEAAGTTTAAYTTTTTVGTMTLDDASVTTTEAYEPTTETVGTGMPEDSWETPTVGIEIPEPVGTMMAPETTEPYFMTDPIGTMTAPDTHVTTTTESIPPIEGETMPPEETTEPDFPPLMGDIAPADGDVDGDGELSVADAVVFRKWLHAVPGTQLTNRWAADLNYDGEVDIYDFALMKRELLRRTVTQYVEPDVLTRYSPALHVIADSVTMYLGPDTSYQAVGTIPQYEYVRELGYLHANDAWILTEYNGKRGWIRILAKDNRTRTVEYMETEDKPVIYLYPKQATDVHVELELTESELATTYPKYQDGWDVTAYPDGTLLNKADGTHHRSLFWDSTDSRTRYDFSKGFCIAGSDTERFLKDSLTKMGLNEDERNEFIVYWLPRMERNAYNLIAFQSDAYTNAAKLTVTPQPDSECRVFMAYVPLEAPIEIEPQQLPTFERKGFAVVEWGGSEIKS